MALKLYNTLTRKKQIFKPIKEGEVRIYVCGPTVNDVPHLGHAKQQVSFDILRRYLIFLGNKVKFVSNITDIDDKIINKANELKVDIKEFTKQNTQKHIEDYQKLNVLSPDVRTKATEYVSQMINLVAKLEKKGFAYIIPHDGVYFDISKFKSYGKLSHQNIGDLKSGARKDINDNKRNPQDFALWKFSKPGEPEWDSPWGKGRPGWHIECSAMSESVLGLPFDIHGGGADLIFPHHEDEIAQSEAAFGKKMCNYWVHNGMVNVEGIKMSKSLGNFSTIRDLFKDFDPLVIRYFVITTQYNKPTDFSKQSLEDAKNSYTRLKNICGKLEDDASDSLSSDNLVKDKNKESTNANCEVKLNEKYLKEFKKAMEDDLNTPKALAVLWELVRDEKAKGKYQTIKKMDEVFGLKLLEKENLEIPEEVKKLAKQRIEAKKQKNYKLADELREKVNKLGFSINDTKEGYEIKKV